MEREAKLMRRAKIIVGVAIALTCLALFATLADAAQGLEPSNPVSYRLEGVRTFDIGVSDTFESVPWGNLLPGDVVNIHHRPEPYVAKFGLRAQGTASAPVVVNGVTDPNGNRPVIVFRGARTAPGSLPVFNPSQPQYHEALGGIVIKRGPADQWDGPKPSHIHIQNLELRNTTGTYTTLNGATRNYGVAACIYVLASSDLLFENLVVSGCQNGIFTMAKEGTLAHTSERLTLRNSRIYGNGRVNSWLEHGVYIQSANPVIEGNFFGSNITGSLGSTIKDRSAGLILRDNYIQCTERCIDVVHSEDNEQGIAALPEYGFDYIYRNVIDNKSAYTVLHYGGDNWCEQDESPEICTPPVKYRSRVHVWDNTFLQNTSGDGWRAVLFDLSLVDTVADVWNNTFVLGDQVENHYLVEYAGVLRWGTNHVTGPLQMNGHDRANPDHIRIEVR